MKLRNATSADAELLNQFIRSSKAVWGYSQKFLDSYIEHWGITTKFLENKSVKILEENGVIHGIFSLGTHKRKIELALFFVNPKLMKQGIGRKMWGMVDEYARAQKWKGFEISADPNAEAFFTRMGAKPLHSHEPAPGHVVSVLRYELSPTDAEWGS